GTASQPSTGTGSQLIDGPVSTQGEPDGNNFYRLFNALAGDAELGGSINWQTPFATINGTSDGQSFDVYSFTIGPSMLQPTAVTSDHTGTIEASGPFFFSVTLKLDGRVSAGDVWHLGIRNHDYTYHAVAGDTLESVANGLGALLPASFSHSVTTDGTGTYLKIDNTTLGFQLTGLHYNGLAQLANDAATITRSTQARQADGVTAITFSSADVTLTGSVAANETWTLTVGGIAHQYVTQSGDQLTDVASALATAFGLTTTTATISFASLTAATIQLSVSGKSPAGGVRVTGTPTPAMASSINWTNVRVAFPTILRPGEQWSVELLGPGSTKATHTVTGADTATSVAAALVTAFGSATGYTISASAGVLDVSRTTAFRSAVTVTASGSGAAGSAHSHTVTF
ncbi:MAG TPA: hypothetical protein VKJ07_10095, partial [Mycobacteriales bacterium]|nr:hypothetical protein [Mycobacteriales bacterium]